MDINELRNEIDDIDSQIVGLYKKRMSIVRRISEYKHENGMPIYVPSREKALLDSVAEQAGTEFSAGIRVLFTEIMNLSRAYQNHIFTHRAEPIICGLLGGKLRHSYSPQIHSCLADYDYRLFSMPLEEVEGFIKGDSWDCLNVTIPYKETVMQYLSSVSDEALRIGSVNTVIRTPDGLLHGENTDYFGFMYLLRKSGIEPKGKKCIILGSGGSAKTVKCVLSGLGAGEIIIISRSGENNYNNISKHSEADIIVNTTPVGMYPDTGKSAVELSDFPNCSGVIDLIYNPSKTKLLLDAERRGICCAGGLPMLVAQAVKSCEIFTKKAVPESEIERITAQIEIQTKNIILIGMPGCGKTAAGSALADKLGREFVDIDFEISVRYGRSPAEILTDDGEKAFRDIESEVAADVCKRSGIVIATGGGVVERPSNADLLRQNGVIFFIKRSLDKLPSNERPITQARGAEALYNTRKRLYYSLCDYEADGNGTVSETVENIYDILEKI